MLVHFKALIFLCLLPCSILFALIYILNPILKQTMKLRWTAFKKLLLSFWKSLKTLAQTSVALF